MAHTDPTPDRDTVSLTDTRSEIDKLERAILAATERHGYSKASRFAIRLAFEEAVVNAFKHGNRGMPAGTPVNVDYEIQPDHVRISVEDQGPGFDPVEIPDPTLDENLEVPSGRGLMLIKAYMTEVRHNAAGNRLEMVYRPPAEQAG